MYDNEFLSITQKNKKKAGKITLPAKVFKIDEVLPLGRWFLSKIVIPIKPERQGLVPKRLVLQVIQDSQNLIVCITEQV